MVTTKRYKSTQHCQNHGHTKLAVLLFALLSGALICPTTYGAFLFLGTGNDGYYTDVSGLWNSLRTQPGWENATSRLLSNRTGTQMLSDISWLEQAGPGDVAVWYYSGHGGSSTYDGNHVRNFE